MSLLKVSIWLHYINYTASNRRTISGTFQYIWVVKHCFVKILHFTSVGANSA